MALKVLILTWNKWISDFKDYKFAGLTFGHFVCSVEKHVLVLFCRKRGWSRSVKIHSYKAYKQASSLKVICSLPVQRCIFSLLLLLLEHVVEQIIVDYVKCIFVTLYVQFIDTRLTVSAVTRRVTLCGKMSKTLSWRSERKIKTSRDLNEGAWRQRELSVILKYMGSLFLEENNEDFSLAMFSFLPFLRHCSENRGWKVFCSLVPNVCFLILFIKSAIRIPSIL
jgi:hypothetical protein